MPAQFENHCFVESALSGTEVRNTKYLLPTLQLKTIGFLFGFEFMFLVSFWKSLRGQGRGSGVLGTMVTTQLFQGPLVCGFSCWNFAFSLLHTPAPAHK